MTFTPRETECRDPDRLLSRSLEPVIAGMGMSLVELSVFRSKRRAKNPGEKPERPAGREKTRREISGDTPPAKLPGVSIRLVVYKDGIIGVDDCSRVHRGITPRLELAFPGQDIYLEVSSPGIDRVIKDGGEFVHYIGQGVRCYRTDISDWTAGILEAADEKGIVLREEKGETILPYEVIAKARLDGALPRHGGAGMTAPERGINKNGTGG